MRTKTGETYVAAIVFSIAVLVSGCEFDTQQPGELNAHHQRTVFYDFNVE